LRVLLAEDHAVVRSAVAALLAEDRGEPGLQVVAVAGDGAQAVEAFRRHRPDVCVFDMRMPGMSGADACAAVRAESSDARVLILSSFEAEEDVYRALNAGALGYLLKDAEPRELAEAVRKVATGRRHVPEHIAAKLLESMGATRLSAREFEVLSLIGEGRTNAQIGRELFISEGTVKTHVNNVLSKLGASDRTQAVVLGLRRGILSLEKNGTGKSGG